MALSVGSSQHSSLLLCGSQEGKSDSREAEFMSCNPKTSYHFCHVLFVRSKSQILLTLRERITQECECQELGITLGSAWDNDPLQFFQWTSHSAGPETWILHLSLLEWERRYLLITELCYCLYSILVRTDFHYSFITEWVRISYNLFIILAIFVFEKSCKISNWRCK